MMAVITFTYYFKGLTISIGHTWLLIKMFCNDQQLENRKEESTLDKYSKNSISITQIKTDIWAQGMANQYLSLSGGPESISRIH